MKAKKKQLILLTVLLIAVFVCMGLANVIQTSSGTVSVQMGSFQTDKGTIPYKLYVPQSASADRPAPGVLLLHGYQNDHETCAAYAIELARRGAVVMAIDEFGHGSDSIGMIERGYTDHKVTVNYGNDSEADGTYVSIGGQKRYRVMMNFSNLSFFDDHYSKGSDGSAVSDSSMGGIAAYAVLADMDIVDPTRLAVSGHSMGTWASWTVAAAYSGATNDAGQDISPKAVVLQCGELFRSTVYDQTIHFNNVLLLQAKYDEFSYFRDYQNNVDEKLLQSPLRTEFLGCTAAEAAWNTTYGSFSGGSARRIELLNTNHRLTTHNSQGMAAAMAWLSQAIGLDLSIPAGDQHALAKETLELCAMLCALAAMIPLAELLLETRFFAPVAQPLPPRSGAKSNGAWWKGAVITMLLAGASFPFMTQLGHGLLPLPEGIFRMTVGNGFLSWYLLLILIMLGTTFSSCARAKRRGGRITMYDMGLGSADAPERFGWGLLGRSALLVLCMLALVYVLNFLCEQLFKLDFRFIWPFFRSFSAARFGQFCVYILIFELFFVLNNSKIFASMRTADSYRPGFGGFLHCWWRNALCMAGGLLLVVLLEYIPFFAGIGPGADVLFGSTFGGPFMSILILFVPQVLVFSVLCTILYRRTGNVFPGALTVGALACWIVTGGSSML